MTQRERLTIRFLQPDTVGRALQGLGVDPYGIRIMQPKAESYCIRLGPVSFAASNILKQEMLSLGGECALPRDAITGRLKRSDCLLIGNSVHLVRLREKLRRQPFGLAAISRELGEAIENYSKRSRVLDIKGKKLGLTKPLVMGIMNITTDSFSGDGLLAGPAPFDRKMTAERGQQLVEEGADILDIGGESSRPGASPVSLKDELKRVVPAVKILAKSVKVPISVDTRRPEVAAESLAAGASIINDITGLTSSRMRNVCARNRCAVVIMHMRGTPRTMRTMTSYGCLMAELSGFFRDAIARARSSGIDEERMILDPGIGFAKTGEQNLEILRNLRELSSFGRPLLVGVSRKAFIGKILDAGPDQRLSGTLAACVLAAANGAGILRVHDVKETAQALKTASAILNG